MRTSHEPKLSVPPIQFIRSKLTIFPLMCPGLVMPEMQIACRSDGQRSVSTAPWQSPSTAHSPGAAPSTTNTEYMSLPSRTMTPITRGNENESFERIHLIIETNGSFNSGNSPKRL